MSRKKIARNADVFDFEPPEHDVDAEIATGFMQGALDATSNQTKMGLELTKLIVENSSEKYSEKDVYSIFKRATKAVSDNHNLSDIFDRLGMR